MLKKPVSLLIAISMIFPVMLPASAQTEISELIPDEAFEDIGENKIYTPDDEVTFIVEVQGNPSAVYKDADRRAGSDDSDYFLTETARRHERTLLNTQNKIINDIETKTDSDIGKGFTYTSLFNGFSIDARYGDIEKIKSIPGVVNVYISETHAPIRPYVGFASEQTGAAAFAQNSGFTGQGQAIAVLDSEFDTNHEFFAAPPKDPKYSKNDIADILENNLFNVSVTANQTYKNEKIPFAYDYGSGDADTFDDDPDIVHGTHVAGIAGGKNGSYPDGSSFSGVAPDTQMILMKISDENGLLPDDAVLAALDDSVKFGVSAINMSFGTDYMSCSVNRVFEQALENARNAGVFLSASAGNSSRGFNDTTPYAENTDYSSSGTPASYTYVTSVASADNIVIYDESGQLILADRNEITYKPAFDGSGFADIFSGRTYGFVYCSEGREEDFAGLELDGKLALIKRGGISFAEKSDNAKNAGAAGIIIWNTDESYINTPELSLPAAFVTLSSGQKLYDSENNTIEVTPLTNRQKPSATGGQISDYSAWGTTDDLELKPEITAPGQNIYSSLPDDKYGYMSGTSMAAPHMTGIAALLNQFYESHPYTDAYNLLEGEEKVTLFENLLMSTADVIKDSDGTPSSPRVQGAGLANIAKAAKTPVVLEGTEGKSKISLKDGLAESFAFSFTAKNLTDTDVVYSSLDADVLTDAYVEENGRYFVGGTKRLSAAAELPDSVVVPAGGETEIAVMIRLDGSELSENLSVFSNGFYIDGFVYLNAESEEACDLNIPFTGFFGDWEDAPVFDSTRYDDGGSLLHTDGDSSAPGTSLMSRFSNQNVILGRNLYNGKIDKEYISFSPNNDNCYDTFIACIQPLRTAKVEFEIYDSANKKLAAMSTNGNINKFYPVYLTLPDSIIGNLEDGDYTLSIKGYYNYDEDPSSPDDGFSLPFTIDTAAPEVSGAVIEGNKLTVTASDNHYIQAAAVYYTTADGMPRINVAPVSNKKQSDGNDTVTLQFDISGADRSSIRIEVCDYAMNTKNVGALSLAYDISYQLTKTYRDPELTVLTYRIDNRSDEVISCTPIMAFYDKSGKLAGISEASADVAPGSFEYRFYIYKDMSRAETVRLFLWDSPEGMEPLSQSVAESLSA